MYIILNPLTVQLVKSYTCNQFISIFRTGSHIRTHSSDMYYFDILFVLFKGARIISDCTSVKTPLSGPARMDTAGEEKQMSKQKKT